MRILGIDPGLQRTGWGIVTSIGNTLQLVAFGIICPDTHRSTAERLVDIDHELEQVIDIHRPDTVAIEETFVNKNALTSLKLGQARGVAMVVPARRGLEVAEYSPNLIKKSIVGAGHADKTQILAMVRMLLPGCRALKADEADALAVAICHAHHAGTRSRIEKALA